MRIGESHIELKVEIYEGTAGVFSSAVFAKEVFLIEPAFISGISRKVERRGMVSLFVEDPFYATRNIRASTELQALEATLQIIQGHLLKSGHSIEYLNDLESG